MTTLTCRCGEVEMLVEGAPFLAAACHCDDCQAGGRQLEALDGAPKVLGVAGGTDYAMVRRDRIRVTRGAERLQEHKLKPGSKMRRVTASCCATPMYADVSIAHWVSTYRDRWGAEAPPLERRVMVQFAPEGELPDDGLPHNGRFPLAAVPQVAGAWGGMILHPTRPRLRWPPENRPA